MLCVDNFGVKYIRHWHAMHLYNTLSQYYNMVCNWGAQNLWRWLSNGIISITQFESPCQDTLLKSSWDSNTPYLKAELSLHWHATSIYSKAAQDISESDTSPLLDKEENTWVQAVVGAVLYYTRCVDNKLFVAIRSITSEQEKSMQWTKADAIHLLDYLLMYPNNGIIYHCSDMKFAAHSDSGYLNITKTRLRVGVYIFLSDDIAIPTFNGVAVIIASITKLCNVIGSLSQTCSSLPHP